jgi:hypothetical protein
VFLPDQVIYMLGHYDIAFPAQPNHPPISPENGDHCNATVQAYAPLLYSCCGIAQKMRRNQQHGEDKLL